MQWPKGLFTLGLLLVLQSAQLIYAAERTNEPAASVPPVAVASVASAATAASATSAAQLSASESSANAIPFKKEVASFGAESLSAMVVTIVLLGCTVTGLYFLRNFLRKKMPQSFQLSGNIKVKERLKVNPKLNLYVIQYRDREIMVGQSGDNLKVITEFTQAAQHVTPSHQGIST